MAGTTPNLGLPYPDGSDPISSGDDVIRSLANQLDTLLTTNRMYRGVFTKTTDGVNGIASVTAAELGMSTPITGVLASVNYGGGVATTTVQLAVARVAATPTSVEVRFWGVSAGSAGTLNVMLTKSIQFYLLAW